MEHIKRKEKRKPKWALRHKMRKLKYIGLFAGMICSMGAATGCSAVIKQEPKEAIIQEYTIDTLPDGYFVMSGDTFYQPYNGDKTYTNLPENTSPERVLWYTDDKIHIPEYKNGDSIVFKSKSTILTQFVLEGFEHICDSVGIRKIRIDDAGNCIISGDDSLHQSSDAYTKLNPYISNSNAIVLDTVNGEKIQRNMINKTGSINGLTKGDTCTIGFYVGTQYYEAELNVDTEIYCSKSINTIEKYDLTKSGYLRLQMPDLMTPGLYDINGSGVVNYKGVLQEGE